MGSFLSNGRAVLDERLSAVAAMVPPCARAADIGCDHGYLAAYLLQNEIAGHVQLCDISAPSLEKARRLLTLLGLDGRASFAVGDGALALTEPVDCAVVAGMGTATIGHILAAGREALGPARLVLQPNLDAQILRAFLVDAGYRIFDETIARAGRRHYVVVAAEPGEAAYSPMELACGPALLKKGGPLFTSFADFRLKVARKALAGAEGADAARAEELRWEIALWEEAKRCTGT